jgi:DNA-binding MarR family transcriptional regulator
MTAALEKDMLPEAGMPLTWFEVLHHLTQAPDGAMRFQELARVSGITDSGASRRLDQMIKAGLIERTACPTDRRGVFAHITAKGQAAYKRGHAVFVRSLRRNLTSQLKPAEIDSLRASLERLA